MTTASLQLCDYIEMTSAPVLAGFNELYERHYEAVFRAALRVTGNPADAEDVLQTVFLRVLARSEGLSRSTDDAAAERPSAYFRRAAVNAAVDLLRRELPRRVALWVGGAGAPPAARGVERFDTLAALDSRLVSAS